MKMNISLDRLQQAWQSQCSKPLDVNPVQLLQVVRLERRMYFWTDVSISTLILGAGFYTLWSAFRDIQQDWPWLIYVASVAWVAGRLLFDRWRRRGDAAHYDEPLLAHVEGAIKQLEHQKWLSGNTLWWYVLPIAVGCMIPPVLLFARDYGKRPLFDSLIPLLLIEVVLATTFILGFLVMKYQRRSGLEKRNRELQELRALRETLLNTDE
jgi:hypothetical protein